MVEDMAERCVQSFALLFRFILLLRPSSAVHRDLQFRSKQISTHANLSHWSVCLSACLSVDLSVCRSGRSVGLSVCLAVRLSVCESVRRSVCQVCMYIGRSIDGWKK